MNLGSQSDYFADYAGDAASSLERLAEDAEQDGLGKLAQVMTREAERLRCSLSQARVRALVESREPARPESEGWALRGAFLASASRGTVLVSSDATLTPTGARESAKRLLAAADDAEQQGSESGS